MDSCKDIPSSGLFELIWDILGRFWPVWAGLGQFGQVRAGSGRFRPKTGVGWALVGPGQAWIRLRLDVLGQTLTIGLPKCIK